VKARRRQRRTVENEMKASKINLSTRGYFTWSENLIVDFLYIVIQDKINNNHNLKVEEVIMKAMLI
jgi:hypothetical protein